MYSPIHPHSRIPWMNGKMQGALDERLRRGDSPGLPCSYGKVEHMDMRDLENRGLAGKGRVLGRVILIWESVLGSCSRGLSKVNGTGSFTQPGTNVFLSCGCVHRSIR